MSSSAGRSLRMLKPFLLMASVLLVALPTAASGRSAYVAMGGGPDAGSVSVLETANDTFGPASIGVGVLPLSAAITPDGTRAYVTNSGLGPTPPFGNTVTAIDTSTNSAIGSPILVGDAPVGIAITPDGTRAYVANLSGGTVSVIDTNPSSPAYNTLTQTIAGLPGAPPSPRGVAIAPDGSRAYVAIAGNGPGGGGGVVAVIDTNPSSPTYNTVVGASIAVGGTPWIPGITPDGRKLYVPTAETNSVKVIDTNPSSPTYNTVTATIASGVPSPYMVAVSPAGSRAYATSGGTMFGGSGPFPDTVAVIDTSADATTGSPITTGEASLGVAFTPDGGHAYVANGAAGTISNIDTVSGSPTTVTPPGNPLFAAMTPAQGAIADFTASAAVSGSATTFSAASAENLNGSEARYDWNFGDGATATNAGRAPSHSYASPGTYDVTLTVITDLGSFAGGVFTGQTASVRQGAPATATKTVAVTVPSGDSDASAPTVSVKSPKKNQKIKRKKFKKVSGTASDPAGISKVEYAISTKVASKKAKSAKKKKKKKKTKCRYLGKNRRLGSAKSCKSIAYLEATGTTSWSAKIKKVLPRGSYTLYVRATDTRGNVSAPTKVSFRLV